MAFESYGFEYASHTWFVIAFELILALCVYLNTVHVSEPVYWIIKFCTYVFDHKSFT